MKIKAATFAPLSLMLCLCLPVLAASSPEMAQVGERVFSGSEAGMSSRIQDLLDYRTLGVRDDGSSRLQKMRLAGEKAPASLNAILLMCDFSDSLMLGRYGQVPGDFPPPMQSEIYYAAHDSVFFDHLIQDVADYYDNVSGGAFSLNFTIHPRVVNLPNPMGFYGNHPTEGEQPILMAAAVVDSLDSEIDFSPYDTVILIHAGAGEETDILGNSPEQIYSTYLDPDDFAEAHEDSLIEFPYLPTDTHPDGEGITHVLVLPECEYQDRVDNFGGRFGSLGVYCFEVGLRLGMLSLSDFTPGGRPDSQGIGEFGLMGYGLFVGMGWIPPHPCAYNKQLMGWLSPQELTAGDAREYFLTPSEQSADPQAAIRVDLTGQEYWLLAYRMQDPDGNRIFTHPGDLNGNNIPDFFDDDSEYGNGIPTGFFDPDTDTRERLLDCEWDFFMSENSARLPYVKGAGSGVYIWHIDEGVVQWAFDQPSNLFNSDPDRKSVDLEEADGIQDLDSRTPSAYQLGGDDDSFRGEDADHFDPWTYPNTSTNGGAFSGVIFSDFRPVVSDSAAFISYINNNVSPPDTIMGFVYNDTITFTLAALSGENGGPAVAARRQLPAGMDLRGSHLLFADLDGDGLEEIIAAGHEGEVLVFDGNLDEFLDHDSDPDTFEPFAVGLQDGEPVAWNLPPAVGNIDEDPQPEIVLTGPRGIYAFDIDGTPLRNIDPDSDGLYWELENCQLPVVLLPVDVDSLYTIEQRVSILAVESTSTGTNLVQYRGNGDLTQTNVIRSLGPVVLPAAPVQAWDMLLVAAADTTTMEYALHLLNPGGLANYGPDPHALQVYPGAHPLSSGFVDPSRPDDTDRFVVVTGLGGNRETVFLDEDGESVADNIPWDNRAAGLMSLAPGGALISGDQLGRAGHNGEWLDGWPVQPNPSTMEGSYGSGPLVCTLVDSDLPLSQYLFPVSDGRIFGMGTQAEEVPGWPLAGPAECAGTPALGQAQGGQELDLAAVGTFDRIQGLDGEGEQLVTATVSVIQLWADVAEAEATWPMHGGSPWRHGNWAMQDLWSPPGAAEGQGIVSGSHFCYPSPLRSGPLKVRASVRAPGRAKAEIYTLTGELVKASSWQAVAAKDPFAIVMDLPGVVSGMYICRLSVEGDDGGLFHSVTSLAIAR